jgi:predicted PurR-regulated permease PerM
MSAAGTEIPGPAGCDRRGRVWRWVGLAAALAAAGLYFYYSWPIWPPILAAFLLAMVLDPLVDRLEVRGWPRTLAVLLIFVGTLAALGTLLFLAIPTMTQQLGAVVTDLDEKFPGITSAQLEKTARILLRRTEAPAWMRGPVMQLAHDGTKTLSQSLTWFSQTLVRLIPNLAWVVIVPLVAFYALSDYHVIYAKFLLLLPVEQRKPAQELIAEITAIFGTYLRSLALLCAMNGAANGLLLVAMGVPYALTLGVLTGLLYAVPLIGPIAAVALVAVVALISVSIPKALLVVGITILLQQVVFDQILAPRILGSHIGLNPILTIIALLSGQVIFGLGGLLLAVPLAASIQRVILHVVPKLNRRLELKPMEELRDDVEATQAEERAAEAEVQATDHSGLEQAIENLQ